jgi:hypothetical protein
MNELHTSRALAQDLLLTDTSRRLKKLMIKLRWMGMEEEARRLRKSLCQAWLTDGAFACEPEPR